MSWTLFETVGLLAVIFVLLYYYSLSKLQFWKKRGVKGPKPIPFFGNYKDVFLKKASTGDIVAEAYEKYKDEPMYGLYDGHVPLLVLNDPELIRDILITDFVKFADRMPPPMEEVEPLSLNLFRLESKRWRPLRSSLTSVFSSGKLKEMFHLLLECADHFENYLDKVVAKDEQVDCREITSKFGMDLIASCAFGLEINALSDEYNEFYDMGKKIFSSNNKDFIRDRLVNFPLLQKIFGRFVIDYSVADFFTKITMDTIGYRIKNNIIRHDFIDTLVDVKKHPEKLLLKEVNATLLSAQSFSFFVAGFETTSLTLSNTLYELAFNPSIQDKLRDEVNNVLRENDGKITYDSIQNMKYLDACMYETLRKYPVAVWLSRRSVAAYTFNGTNVTIPEGILTLLPVYCLHHDPKIFSNPSVYDPERFIDQSKKAKYPMVFLPFGDGPRNCIGMRFAKNEFKVALITILSKYKIDTCEKTVKEYKLHKMPLFMLQPDHGIYVKLTKIEK